MIGWAASVYYLEIDVRCDLQRAWNWMLNYGAWNPSFVDAKVTLVRGQRQTPGELVLIRKSTSALKKAGTPLPKFYSDIEFYAETVRIDPPNRLVWYLYQKDVDTSRNFVDFSLAEEFGSVKFTIRYYAQDRLPEAALTQHRADSEAALRGIATAFKDYCEARASRG
jgi:hypothetical protein